MPRAYVGDFRRKTRERMEESMGGNAGYFDYVGRKFFNNGAGLLYAGLVIALLFSIAWSAAMVFGVIRACGGHVTYWMCAAGSLTVHASLIGLIALDEWLAKVLR